MKVVGLITEYNPFHNGHRYHIEQAKEITGADYVIAVMSGNFVQRGAPALIDKYSRTMMALGNGVDLVIELPVCYATASAEYFAHGAVSVLDKLGVVDALCFGSECGDISKLSTAARFLLDSPAAFEQQLLEHLKEGLPYPAARAKAMEQHLGVVDDSKKYILSGILAEPNNILGIEYMKALIDFSSDIEPFTIKRIQAHYHEKDLSSSSPVPGEKTERSVPVISSATAIRHAILERVDEDFLSTITQSVPPTVARQLIDQYQITYPVWEENFASILRYKLRMEDSRALATYLDITPDLAERLKNRRDYNLGISELLQSIKTKNMTLTRINRALLHIILDIKSDNIKRYQENGWTPYARILGIRKEATPLLRLIEQKSSIPTIKKLSKAEQQLTELGLQMLSEDIFAAEIYDQAVYEKFGTKPVNEYQRGICIR